MNKFRNLTTVIAGVTLALALCGCGKAEKPVVATQTSKNVAENTVDNKSEQKIVIRKGDKQVIVKLGQGSAAKDLYKRLPLKVKFEDFNSTEKIAYLNSTLNLQEEPKGYTPQVGDLAYYAPWKNLSVFYKDFRYSESLIYLGKIEKDTANLESFEGEDIIIEAVKQALFYTVNIPAGVKHWHGAAPDSWFSHLAIEVPGEEGSNEWLEPVIEDYAKLK